MRDLLDELLDDALAAAIGPEYLGRLEAAEYHTALCLLLELDRRFSPFFAIGVGKFRNFPNQSLVGATTTDAKLANAGVGVRYHLTDRFVLRADYSFYTVFVNDAKTTEYRAFSAGLAFFF